MPWVRMIERTMDRADGAGVEGLMFLLPPLLLCWKCSWRRVLTNSAGNFVQE